MGVGGLHVLFDPRMKEGARKKVHDQMKKVPGPKLSTKTSDERMNENTSV
jgi:hypothetical protein